MEASLSLAMRSVLLCAATVLADSSGVCSSARTHESILLQTGHSSSVLRTEDAPALQPGWALHADVGAESSEGPALVQEAVQASEDASAYMPTAKEMEHFNLVKAERARGWTCPNGQYFPPNNGEFKWDCRLAKAARAWSQRMANENFVAHRKDGSTSCTRTEAQGFPRLKGCGENIAAGDGSPQGAIDQLKKSNNHCTNMFEPKFNKLGVGFANSRNSKYQDYWTDSFGEWHYGPDESCIGGYPAPTPPPGCADIDTMNCQTYKDQGLCTVSPNVMAQCKDTCGIGNCGTKPSPPRPTSGCSDLDGACASYKSQGMCQTSAHIRKHCQKTCGICGSAPAAPVQTSGCSDLDGACASYKSQGMCQTSAHIRKHCQKTCGICGSAPAAPVQTSGCSDLDGACASYKSQGMCQTSAHIRKHCQKTCGLCGSPSTGAVAACGDIDGACDYYERKGYCSTDHIKKNCQKTCGEC